MRSNGWIVGLGIVVGAVACDGDHPLPTVKELCEPGRAIACACTDGASGAQICAADGSGYQPCKCASATGSGGAGGFVSGKGGAGGYLGSGGGVGGTGGAGAIGGTVGTSGSGGSIGSGGAGGNLPACPSGVKNKGACTSEPSCNNTCGPLKSGTKACTCAGGIWSCPTCVYSPNGDYSCYRLPATLAACPEDSFNNPDPSGMHLPQSGDACTLPTCSPCGSGTNNAYRDAAGSPRVGYCVCTGGTEPTYSCASTAEWPPQ